MPTDGGLAKQEKTTAAAAATVLGAASPETATNFAKTERTIQHLARLLEAQPAAEELSETWQRPSTSTRLVKTIKSKMHVDTPPSEAATAAGPRLGDLYRVLDAGRTIRRGAYGERGVPMWIVVRMCKASWHRDGTWPLRGSDEGVPSERGVEVRSNQPIAVQQSIHPANAILRPIVITSPSRQTVDDGPPARQEWSADQIAAAYRRRGIEVDEAPPLPHQEDW